MEEQRERQRPLKRTLGLMDATAISVGAIIGGGIFVVTGIVAGFAGSALVVSMAVAAVVAVFTALSFAELAAWMPVEGSTYEYTRTLVSPFWGFLTGWMWIITNTFGGAAVSLGFAYYFSSAFPVFSVKIVAAIVCLAFAALNFVGLRESAWLNTALVAVKLGVLGFFVVFGLTHFSLGNFSSFNPFSSGVLFGVFFIFFAYGGFARVAVVAEEVKDAERTVPRAIFLSLVISAVVYVLVGLVAVGLVGAGGLAGSNSPLSLAIDATGSSLAVEVVSIGGLVATASVLLTAILGVSRMAFSMARRSDMPHVLEKIHGRFGTPYVSIWATGVVMALLVLFVDLTHVVAVSTFALLFGYAFANLSAFNLKNGRKYRKYLALVGLATCLMLMTFLLFVSPSAWIVGVAFISAGAAIYYVKRKLPKRK